MDGRRRECGERPWGGERQPPPPSQPRPGAFWEVVGGSEKGGIVVRHARDAGSQVYNDRLSFGSVLEAVERKGEEIHFRRVSGSGPMGGWVSLQHRGRPMVALRMPRSQPTPAPPPPNRGQRMRAPAPPVSAPTATSPAVPSFGSRPPRLKRTDPSPALVEALGLQLIDEHPADNARARSKLNAMDLLRSSSQPRPRRDAGTPVLAGPCTPPHEALPAVVRNGTDVVGASMAPRPMPQQEVVASAMAGGTAVASGMAAKHRDEELDGRARVYVRMKPNCGPARALHIVGDGVVSLIAGDESRDFGFDGVFAENSLQVSVFERVGPSLVRGFLSGINGTILAYGQTGSGKTYSLLNTGPRAEDAGLLPRVVVQIFSDIHGDPANMYEVQAAAVQVYNEEVDDLLHTSHQNGGGQNLKVQDGGVIPGLTWILCRQPEEMLLLFGRAHSNVIYAQTLMNKSSSRSHAIFHIKVTRKPAVGGLVAGGADRWVSKTARLNIVDLAGSERVKKSGVEGVQFREATQINNSLLALGNVMNALAAKKTHVPFRDSKLTRILDGCIGGNCRTVLLACISPCVTDCQETLCCLDFASRAMNVEVKAKVNANILENEADAKALLRDLGLDEGALGIFTSVGGRGNRRRSMLSLGAIAQIHAGATEMAAEAEARAEKAAKRARDTAEVAADWQERAAAAEATLQCVAENAAERVAAAAAATATERQRASEAAARAREAEDRTTVTEGAIASWQERAGEVEQALEAAWREAQEKTRLFEQHHMQEEQRISQASEAARLAEHQARATQQLIADLTARASAAEGALVHLRTEVQEGAALDVGRCEGDASTLTEQPRVALRLGTPLGTPTSAITPSPGRRFDTPFATPLGDSSVVAARFFSMPLGALPTDEKDVTSQESCRKLSLHNELLQQQLVQQSKALAEAYAAMDLQRLQAESREAQFRSELETMQLKASFASQEVGLQRRLAEALEAGHEARAAAGEALKLRQEAASAASEAQAARLAVKEVEERQRLEAARGAMGGSFLVAGSTAGSQLSEGHASHQDMRQAQSHSAQSFFLLPPSLFPDADSSLSRLMDSSSQPSSPSLHSDGASPVSPQAFVASTGLSNAAWSAQYISWLGVSAETDMVLYNTLAAELSNGLPPGWSIHVDGQGRAYFWSALTNESLWTHPDHEILNAIVRLYRLALQRADPLEFLEQIVAKLGSQDAGLGKRWSGPFSAEDGNQYWYDSEKDVSTWSDPVAELSRKETLKVSLVQSLLLAMSDVDGISPGRSSSYPSPAAMPRDNSEHQRRCLPVGGSSDADVSTRSAMPHPTTEVLMKNVAPLEAESDALSQHVAHGSAPPTASPLASRLDPRYVVASSSLSRSASATFGGSSSPAAAIPNGTRVQESRHIVGQVSGRGDALLQAGVLLATSASQSKLGQRQASGPDAAVKHSNWSRAVDSEL